MKLSKVKNEYGTYKAEMTHAEIVEITKALDSDGTGALADELLHAFRWYADRLPGPGEDEEEKGEKKEPDVDEEVEAEADKYLPREVAFSSQDDSGGEDFDAIEADADFLPDDET